MDSRRAIMSAIKKTDKRLKRQQAHVNQHQQYVFNWLHEYKIPILAISFTLSAILIKVSGPKRIANAPQKVGKLIGLIAIPIMRTKIIKTLFA